MENIYRVLVFFTTNAAINIHDLPCRLQTTTKISTNLKNNSTFLSNFNQLGTKWGNRSFILHKAPSLFTHRIL